MVRIYSFKLFWLHRHQNWPSAIVKDDRKWEEIAIWRNSLVSTKHCPPLGHRWFFSQDLLESDFLTVHLNSITKVSKKLNKYIYIGYKYIWAIHQEIEIISFKNSISAHIGHLLFPLRNLLKGSIIIFNKIK